MRLDAILFDADGTLVDSEVPGLDVLHRLAVARGLALPRHEAHARFRGVPMREVVAEIATTLGWADPAEAARFEQAVRAAMAERFRQGVDAMPGATALLQRLAVPFGVATNGPRDKVELTLGMSGLRPLVGGRIFSAYEVGSFKPAPGLFLHAARALDADPVHCAVVEDSATGVQAGLAAGMHVFSLCPPDALADAGHPRLRFIDGLGDLLRLLPAQALHPSRP